MKRIHYAGHDFLTGDRIAQAVINYATALARRSRADQVSLPVLLEGRMGRVELVIGPASQLLAESVQDARDDPIDKLLIDDLERRTRQLRNPQPQTTQRTADRFDFPDDGLG